MNIMTVAYHEAGHAVARWEFGHHIKKATVVLDKDCAGYVSGKRGFHGHSLESLNSEIVSC
jgi:hypothetical protein